MQWRRRRCDMTLHVCENIGSRSAELQEHPIRHEKGWTKIKLSLNTLPAVFSGCKLAEKQAQGALGVFLGLGFS